MDVRTSYHIAEEINAVIQAIEDQKTNCTDYQLNLESGTADQIPAYEKPISRADTERMQNLLRQFSFLILQSMNPIAGYEDNEGNIKANFLINALEEQQISKENMDQYLAEYGTQYEIPDTISQALQSTDSQDNIYSLMLESELVNLIQYLKGNVSKKLTEPTLKAEFNTKTKELETSPVREQIMAILNWLLEKYSANKKLIVDNIGAINNHQSTTGLLSKQLSEKKDEIFKLESDLESVKKQLTSALNTIGDLQSAQKPAEPTPKDNTLNELREALAKAHGERDTIAQKLQEENDALKTTIRQLEQARATSNVLQSALSTAANPKQIPFITKVEDIVNAVRSKAPYELKVNSPFQELYTKLSEHKGELTDVCEFTYLATFFLNKIFRQHSKLYDLLNTIIGDYMKQHPEDLDNTMQAMFNLLEASENQTISDVGYYVIPDAENMGQLKKLQASIDLEADTINTCNNAFNAAFPNYNKNNTQFIIPNGFIVGPVRAGSITKYNLQDNTFVKGGPVENKFKGISYQAFFILYTLVIKSYLSRVQSETTCPKSAILTDPEYFKNRDKKRTFKATVKTPI
jgi:ABC-type transporter Mla subunit MlaD